MARTVKSNAWNEVFALILLGVGTLLFLALISYTPKDVPSWIWFSQVSSPKPAGPEFHRAVRRDRRRVLLHDARRRVVSARGRFARVRRREIISCEIAGHTAGRLDLLFIVSGACLLQLQTQHLQGWRTLFNIPGPGGWIGYVIGKKLLLTWMGNVGSMILLTGLYLSSLILMTGLRPIHLVRQTVAGIRQGMVALARMAIEAPPAQIRPRRPARNQPAGTRETAAGHRKTAEEKRRSGFRAGSGRHFAGRTDEPAQAESRRYDRAARASRRRKSRRWRSCAEAKQNRKRRPA